MYSAAQNYLSIELGQFNYNSGLLAVKMKVTYGQEFVISKKYYVGLLNRPTVILY